MTFELVFTKGKIRQNGKRNIWWQGSAFSERNRLEDLEVILRYMPLNIEKNRNSILRQNGFFSFAIAEGNRILAFVDRIRSYPLFYALQEEKLFLGDNPYEIQRRLGSRQIDPVSLAEFLLTGYVIGDSTFDPRIKQLPAGEILLCEDINSKWHISRTPYYWFHHHDFFQHDLEILQNVHEAEMDKAVSRLMAYAAGSMIAVPLSGGYDSRFVLMTLKRLKYPRLLAFSYGLPGNPEAETSRSVAEHLGVPWHFVPYSPEKWRIWFGSPEWQDYMTSAEAMVSVAHLQDWPAVWELKKKGYLDNDAVFAPGHSGDFLGGKQIPRKLRRKRKLNKRDVLKAVWNRHYVNTTLRAALINSGVGGKSGQIIRERIVEHFSRIDITNREAAINAFDFEFWQEKLAKFIVNSMRVYEFWGYRWWLPFYDTKLVEFWEKVPLRYRVNKVLYDRTVDSLQSRLNIELAHAQKNKSAFGEWLRAQDWVLVPYSIMVGRKKLIDANILGAIGAFPEKEIKNKLGWFGNINTMLGYWHMEKYTKQG